MKYWFFTNKKKVVKSGILFGTIIFLVLNVVFAVGILAAIFRVSEGAAVYEQAYAKEIALMLDSAKPLMKIDLEMSKGMEIAKKNKLNPEDIIKIENNKIVVRLSSGSGYSYPFFNDVEVNSYPSQDFENYYVFIVNERENENE